MQLSVARSICTLHENREKKKPAASFDSIFQVVSQAQASLPFFYACLSVKPITTSPGGQEGGG